jgi:hypothetical protein
MHASLTIPKKHNASWFWSPSSDLKTERWEIDFEKKPSILERLSSYTYQLLTNIIQDDGILRRLASNSIIRSRFMVAPFSHEFSFSGRPFHSTRHSTLPLRIRFSNNRTPKWFPR